MKKTFAIAAVVSAAVLAAAETASVPPVATKFLAMFDDLRSAEAQKAAGKYRHVVFRITASEINDYMKWSLRATPRPGLDSVTVKIFRNNYISTFTMVDFDAVEKWRPGTIPGVLRPVLSGKKSIWVDYRFLADNSKVTFTVEKAYYGSVRIPTFVVQKMIEIVAARQAEKYDASKPLPIPFGLKKIWTEDQAAAGEN